MMMIAASKAGCRSDPVAKAIWKPTCKPRANYLNPKEMRVEGDRADAF